MKTPVVSSAHLCQESGVGYRLDGPVEADLPRMHRLMRHFEQAHPEWFHAFDHLDPCACAVDDMQRAMATAPDPFLAGMVYGMLVVRTRVDGLLGP